MKLKLLAIFAAVSVAACNSGSNTSSITEAANRKFAECDAQTFKTRTARALCMNDAGRIMLPYEKDPDLLQMMMAKDLELAERIDRKQITIAQAELERAQFNAQVMSEKERRSATRSATAANNSIAYSNSRIANAAEQMATPTPYSTNSVNAIFTPIQQMNNRMGNGF